VGASVGGGSVGWGASVGGAVVGAGGWVGAEVAAGAQAASSIPRIKSTGRSIRAVFI
jgi:hypothetical protein